MRNDRYESLDGIKGFALIGIIWYHLSQRSLPGGFIGVDVFFTRCRSACSSTMTFWWVCRAKASPR